MQFLIVLVAAVALAGAQVAQVLDYKQTNEYQAPVLRSDYEINPDGSYAYAYETGNGIAAQAQGVVRNPNTVSGSSHTGREGLSPLLLPDGTPVELTYEADENGYRPTGSHIPAVPEAILRSLAYIAANSRPDEYAKKTV